MQFRTLLLLCVASSLWALNFGLGTQVTSHWLHYHQASDTVIGMNHACYYLGVALGSLVVPVFLRRYGPCCSAWGMALAGFTLVVFPFATGPFGWFVLRLANGLAGALSLVPLEAIVSSQAQPEHRTRNFGFYAVSLTLGAALGINLGLNFVTGAQLFPFFLGGFAPILGALLCFKELRALPKSQEAVTTRQPLQLVRDYLSYVTACCQGFLEGGMLAFLSLYLVARGLSAETAGNLLGLTMVGVILFQIPVSWLADRLGPRRVLVGCYALVIVGLLAIPMSGSLPWLAASLFVFGASSGALYPLGLSLLGQPSGESALIRSYALYTVMECVGSQFGAVAMGQARDWWGESAMFGISLVAVFGALASWYAVEKRRKPTPPARALPWVEEKSRAA